MADLLSRLVDIHKDGKALALYELEGYCVRGGHPVTNYDLLTGVCSTCGAGLDTAGDLDERAETLRDLQARRVALGLEPVNDMRDETGTRCQCINDGKRCTNKRETCIHASDERGAPVVIQCCYACRKRCEREQALALGIESGEL